MIKFFLSGVGHVSGTTFLLVYLEYSVITCFSCPLICLSSRTVAVK